MAKATKGMLYKGIRVWVMQMYQSINKIKRKSLLFYQLDWVLLALAFSVFILFPIFDLGDIDTCLARVLYQYEDIIGVELVVRVSSSFAPIIVTPSLIWEPSWEGSYKLVGSLVSHSWEGFSIHLTSRPWFFLPIGTNNVGQLPKTRKKEHYEVVTLQRTY